MSRRDITEFIELPQVEHPYVKGPRGHHVTEICASFDRGADDNSRTAPADIRLLCRPAPCDEWSYIQMFCGIATADTIIRRVHALANTLRADGAAGQWFYVRYDDRGYHVRVRVRAHNARERPIVISALNDLASALRGEGLITFTRQEQYVPEVSRYGGPDAIGAAEKLFCADSDSVAEYLGSRPPEVQRLAMASRTVSSWWQHAADRRADLYPAMRAAQRRLWPGGKWPSKGVGRVWRGYRAQVDKEMRSLGARAHGEQELTVLLGRVRQGGEQSQVAEIIGSAVHMHCNRLFACDNRRMEALAYEFALREMLRADALRGGQRRGREGPQEG